MKPYLDIIAMAHAAVAALLFLVGGGAVLLSLLIDVYSVYDFVHYLSMLEPGAKPAFCYTGEHGKGVGKTVTGEVATRIAGGERIMSLTG